jgi:hypothetical protein
MNDDDFREVIQSAGEGREVFARAMAHARALVDDGHAVAVKVGVDREPIEAKQRKFLKDIVFGQIAEQVCVGDKRERFTKQIWAEFYRERLLGSRWELQKMPGAKRATPRRIRNSTEELGVRRYAAYIDEVIQIATTEYDVHFVFKRDEREGTRPAHHARQRQGEHQ